MPPLKMRQQRGKLVVRHGPMWSDKTTWLIDQHKQSPNNLAVKPALDNRYTSKAVLRNHNGEEVTATLVDQQKPASILRLLKNKKGIERLLIDETNFFDDQLIKVVTSVLNKGIDVYAAGLMLDSDRRDFGPTKKLMKMADEVIEGRARCDFRFANGVCLNPAQYTFAKIKKDQLVVGAADVYGAACSEHYHLLHVSKKGNGRWLSRLRLPKSVGISDEVRSYLTELKLPYLRRPLKYDLNRWPRIEVGADTMRVGKTTAVQVLSRELKRKKLPVKISLEDWQNNPHLTKSYKDSSLALLNSQKWFIKRKFDQVKKGARVKSGQRGKAIWIQDVHPEMDFCYALTNLIMGRMSLNNFKDYADYFNSFDWSSLPAADTLLYLTASDEVVLKRAQANLRPFEIIEKDYFLVMKRVNQAWLAGTKYLLDVVVMPINTDNFNFAVNRGPKEKLTKNVLKKLNELGWKYS